MRLNAAAWSLEPESVNGLLEKIRSSGIPLAEFAGVKPLMGHQDRPQRGFPDRHEDAGLDHRSRSRARGDHPTLSPGPGHSAVVSGMGRSLDDRPEIEWRLSLAMGRRRRSRPRHILRKTYPGLHAHLKPLEDALRKRQDQGRFWWELRACAYWGEFVEAPDHLSGHHVDGQLLPDAGRVSLEQHDVFPSDSGRLAPLGPECAHRLVVRLEIGPARKGRGPPLLHVVHGDLPGSPAERRDRRSVPQGRSTTDRDRPFPVPRRRGTCSTGSSPSTPSASRTKGYSPPCTSTPSRSSPRSGSFAARRTP